MKQSSSSNIKRSDGTNENCNIPYSDLANKITLTDHVKMLSVSGDEEVSCQNISSGFKFNFQINSDINSVEKHVQEQLHSESSNVESLENSGVELKSLHYKPSNNAFKFNFDI